MSLAPPPTSSLPTALRIDADGVYRLGESRVTWDTLMYWYDQGIDPEGFVQKFPSAKIADVYTAIGYALDHWDEIQEYLRKSREHAEEVRRENEARFPPDGIRERLLARRQLKASA